MKQFKAKVQLKPHLLPKFIKVCPLLCSPEAELQRLEKYVVIEKVTYSKWGSPTVVVPKKGEKVRICGDYCQPLSGCRQTFSPLPQVERSSPSWT